MTRTKILLVTSLIVFVLSTAPAWSQTGGTFTYVIPQIVAGSFDGGVTKYSTVIEIVNPNVTSVTVSGNFYREDGTPSNLLLATTATVVPTIINGVLDAITLDPGKVLIISVGTNLATTPSVGTIAWGRIVTNGQTSIATVFELRNTQTNALQSRVGVQTSPATMTKFVIPRFRNVADGFDVGFALVNTAPTAGTLTVMLKDASGATIASRNITMSGSSHQSLFAKEFFGLTNEPSGTNYNYILFDSGNAAQFGAIALAFEGGTQTSFPVDVLH